MYAMNKLSLHFPIVGESELAYPPLRAATLLTDNFLGDRIAPVLSRVQKRLA